MRGRRGVCWGWGEGCGSVWGRGDERSEGRLLGMGRGCGDEVVRGRGGLLGMGRGCVGRWGGEVVRGSWGPAGDGLSEWWAGVCGGRGCESSARALAGTGRGCGSAWRPAAVEEVGREAVGWRRCGEACRGGRDHDGAAVEEPEVEMTAPLAARARPPGDLADSVEGRLRWLVGSQRCGVGVSAVGRRDVSGGWWGCGVGSQGWLVGSQWWGVGMSGVGGGEGVAGVVKGVRREGRAGRARYSDDDLGAEPVEHRA